MHSRGAAVLSLGLAGACTSLSSVTPTVTEPGGPRFERPYVVASTSSAIAPAAETTSELRPRRWVGVPLTIRQAAVESFVTATNDGARFPAAGEQLVFAVDCGMHTDSGYGSCNHVPLSVLPENDALVSRIRACYPAAKRSLSPADVAALTKVVQNHETNLPPEFVARSGVDVVVFLYVVHSVDTEAVHGVRPCGQRLDCAMQEQPIVGYRNVAAQNVNWGFVGKRAAWDASAPFWKTQTPLPLLDILSPHADGPLESAKRFPGSTPAPWVQSFDDQKLEGIRNDTRDPFVRYVAELDLAAQAFARRDDKSAVTWMEQATSDRDAAIAVAPDAKASLSEAAADLEKRAGVSISDPCAPAAARP